MRIITFSSDFGYQDYYVGVVKGVILQQVKEKVFFIDLTHHIKPFNVAAGAYVIKSSFSYFPAGSIHLVIVDPTVGSSRKPLAVYAYKQWFLGPDNGIFSYILPRAEKVLQITAFPAKSRTFHARDIFAPAAIAIINNKENTLGNVYKNSIILDLSPKIYKNKILGKIIYIDHFGNLVSNITTEELDLNKSLKIKFKGKIISLYNTYSDVNKGEVLALINSSCHLEISVNQGNAKEVLSANEDDLLEVELL